MRLRSHICLIILAVAAVIGIIWFCFGPVFSGRTLNELRNATKAEVIRVLGDPSMVDDGGVWFYRRWGNFGHIEVYFDETGRVSEINDESAIGPATR